MSSLLPVMVYGLEVPSGDIIVPAVPSFPATFRITMAALDPSAPPKIDATANGEVPVRATLKIVRQAIDEDEDDSEDDSDDEDYMNALLGGADSDQDEDTSSEEEVNGGPSDPAKTKKARKEKAVADLKKALEDEEEMDIDDSLTNGMNGILSKINKGKSPATGDEDDSEDDDENEDGIDVEEFVLCTLDPEKNYQQPLDITIGEDERVFFKVSGTHTVYLTGNYVIPADSKHGDDEDDYDSEDDEDYDLSPDEDEAGIMLADEDESDELDDLPDPRITEVSTDDDEVRAAATKSKSKSDDKKKEPKTAKGKNKRAATASDSEDDKPATSSLDDIMAKSLKPAATNGTPASASASADAPKPLSKKQLKKLKNNAGQPVAATPSSSATAAKDSPATAASKKVQFAATLEQGPTPNGNGNGNGASSTASGKLEKKPAQDAKPAPDAADSKLGPRLVQGVTVDDRKLGKGRACRPGDRVSMRYIGKLESGVVFDSNKTGTPFSFKLGAGEVIKGWDIGIAGMAVGGERRITIPANLAYGRKATGGIPAGSTLKFEVKLLTIK